MYEFKDRVRYSETDEHGECTITALVNYLQDCATFHSHDSGLGIECLKEMKRAWLLSGWDIYIARFPFLGERITVGTSPHPVKGILVDRDLWVRSDDKGDYILKAHSLWFAFDTERMRPVRITEDLIKPFGELRDFLMLPQSDRKIILPQDMQETAPVTVTAHMIDSNHHINNAHYIAAADETLAMLQDGRRRFHSGRIRAEYKKPAMLNDILIPYYGRTENGMIVSLRGTDGGIYANVEMTRNAADERN